MLALNLKWSYWKRIPQWIAEPKNFWLFAGGVLIACLLGDWSAEIFAPSAPRQDRIRYSGWLLDILGLVSIAMGISSKLDRFKGNNLLQLAFIQLFTWLARFPLLRRDQVVNLGSAHIHLQPATVEAYGKTRPNADWPLEQKVEWLLSKHDELTDNVQELYRDLRDKEKSLADRLGEIDKAFETRLKELEINTVDIQVGEVGKEVVGLFWVFLGITFATIPEVIEAVFPWLIHLFQAIGTAVSSLLSINHFIFQC